MAEVKPVAKVEPKAPAQVQPPAKMAEVKPVAKVETKTPAQVQPPAKMAEVKPVAKVAPKASVQAQPAKLSSEKWEINPDVKKFFAARETADYAPSAQASSGGGLAGRYGETGITAMAKGPGLLYVYWEVTPERADEAQAAIGKHWSMIRWQVRIYDVTGGAEGEGSSLFYDFAADSGAGALYADLPRAEREYIAAIGFIDNEGKFKAIAFSNKVGAPAPEIAGITQEGISTLVDAMTGPVSGSPFGMSPGGREWGLLSGIGLSGAGLAAAPGRRMWLNTELTVYGGVYPIEASVQMGGRELPLDSGGLFTVKFFLQDGVTALPVKAKWLRDGAEMSAGVTVTQSTQAIR
jgi:hypothetical protein